MKLNLGLLFKIVQAVPVVFSAAENLSGKHGVEKENAAIALSNTIVAALEGTLDKDVLNDTLVQNATRGVYQAVANLDKVIKDVQLKKTANSVDSKTGE